MLVSRFHDGEQIQRIGRVARLRHKLDKLILGGNGGNAIDAAVTAAVAEIAHATAATEEQVLEALQACGAYRAMNKAALNFYATVRRDGIEARGIDREAGIGQRPARQDATAHHTALRASARDHRA